jgi:glucose/mannose-6-phosphate isomerase
MNTVLDDVEGIKRIDRDGMLTILQRLPEYCKDAVERANKLRIPKIVEISGKRSITYRTPKHIIVVGMGGSAIGGHFLKDWLRSSIPIPIEVCQRYTLPAYADKETLVFAISYSGNTEETLTCFLEAVERECMVICISSNGLLQEVCERIGLPLIRLPVGFPPRSAIPYLFFSLVVALKKIHVLTDIDDDIAEVIHTLRLIRADLKPETPISRNIAKKMALSIEGKIPLITCFSFYRSVALRMKTQFNENSKTPATIEMFPELNHNETVGWTGQKTLPKNFSVILLRDPDEPIELKTRIDVTKQLVFDKGAANVFELWTVGKGKLAKMFSTMYIGDYSSIYLAILYGLNPTPVDIIDEIKHQLQLIVDKSSRLKRNLEALIGG